MPGPVFFYFALVAVATLATAVYFAVKPSERTLGFLRPLCTATTFSALAAFFAGVTNGLVALAHVGTASLTVVLPMFAEAPIPLVAGFAVVSVSWLLVAVGLRRQAA